MRSSPFDDDDGTQEEIPQGSTNSLWRRPWWRWNLFTLFAVLFVYVWVRELQSWTAGITIFGTVIIFATWVFSPLIATLIQRLEIASEKAQQKLPTNIDIDQLDGARLITASRILAVALIVISVLLLLVVESFWIYSFYTNVVQLANIGFRNNYWFTLIVIFSLRTVATVVCFILMLGLGLALWILAAILQNQEEMKSKQEEPK